MNEILVHPLYFGPISQYVAIAKAGSIKFEIWDNYQKQTYRNRTYIYGANGKLLLNLPTLHTGQKGSKRLYKDTQIEHQFNSLQIHRKSLEAAYRTSPYFEFYEDELIPLFEGKPKFLLDFNLKCTHFILDCLQLNLEQTETTAYTAQQTSIQDYRQLALAKNKTTGEGFSEYIQVFQSKQGFIPNLSILDLLFNEGPNALTYLEQQALPKS